MGEPFSGFLGNLVEVLIVLVLETEPEELEVLVEGVVVVALLREAGTVNGETGEPRSSSLESSFLVGLVKVRESRNRVAKESAMDS